MFVHISRGQPQLIHYIFLARFPKTTNGLGTRDSGLGWDEDFLDRQHARADADGKLQSHPALNNFRRNEKPSPSRRCLSSKYKGLGRREEGKKGV